MKFQEGEVFMILWNRDTKDMTLKRERIECMYVSQLCHSK